MTVTGRTYPYAGERGLATWRPRRQSLRLVAQVQEILAANVEHLPMTLRQVFYRLVGRYDYDKTEKAYGRLGRSLRRARRAGLVPFDAIRDDGALEFAPSTYDGVDDFWGAVHDRAQRYRLNRQAGQDPVIELWCEAAGLAPQIARVVRPWGVAVYASGGFDSVTAKHAAAQRIIARDAQTVVLHVGDYDASGLTIVDSAAADVAQFCADLGRPGAVEFLRVAVTPAQIDYYALPKAPPKPRRNGKTKPGGAEPYTVQAEALDPADLADELEAELARRTNAETFAEVKAREAEDRAEILGTLGAVIGRLEVR